MILFFVRLSFLTLRKALMTKLTLVDILFFNSDDSLIIYETSYTILERAYPVDIWGMYPSAPSFFRWSS